MIKGKETKKERAVGEEEDAEIPLPIIYFLYARNTLPKDPPLKLNLSLAPAKKIQF